MNRTIIRVVCAAVACLALATTGSPASAHVSADSAVANADGTTTFTFSFDHGCGMSPTIELHMQLPASIDAIEVVSTTQPTGWQADVLDGSVRWTGPPIAAGDAASYTLTTTRFGQAGDTVTFPVVQRCEQGDHHWIDTDPAGAEPAPFVVLDAATAAVPAAPAPLAGGDGASAAQVAVVSIGVAAVAAVGAGGWGRARRARERAQPGIE